MDEDLKPYMRIGPAIIEGKNHTCYKRGCAYCSRSIAPARKHIVEILNMPGVKMMTDKREQLLEQIYEPALNS